MHRLTFSDESFAPVKEPAMVIVLEVCVRTVDQIAGVLFYEPLLEL